MPRVKKVKARKRWRDCQTGLPIEIGTIHYTWKRYRAPRQRSVTYPRASLLTGSETLGMVYDAQDEMARVSSVEDAEGVVEQLEEARDRCDEQADGIEYYFGETDLSGELRDRSAAIEDVLSELEAVIGTGDLEAIQEFAINID